MGNLSELGGWRTEDIRTHLGVRRLPATTLLHPAGGVPVHLIVVEQLFPDVDRRWTRPQSELTGWAWHHDAVAFDGKDRNFDGHSTDEELQRLQIIYDYHLAQGWNGIGYHFVAGLENRVYVPRLDGLDVHRAHVSGGPAGGPNWNRQLLGYCMMGNYSDGVLPDGTVVARQADRPPDVAVRTADTVMRVVTDLVNRRMTLHPHKYYQEKECPGDWTTRASWDGHVYVPGMAAPKPEVAPGVYMGDPAVRVVGKNPETGRWQYEMHFEVQEP